MTTNMHSGLGWRDQALRCSAGTPLSCPSQPPLDGARIGKHPGSSKGMQRKSVEAELPRSYFSDGSPKWLDNPPNDRRRGNHNTGNPSTASLVNSRMAHHSDVQPCSVLRATAILSYILTCNIPRRYYTTKPSEIFSQPIYLEHSYSHGTPGGLAVSRDGW